VLKFGSVSGKTVLITGGGTGLGRGFALRFAAEGAHVALVARRADRLESVADEVRAAGGKASVYSLDIRHADLVNNAVAQIVDSTGRLDILINNAAGNFISRAENVSPNGWKAVTGIVLDGAFHCASAAGRAMMRIGQGGKILSIVASYAWVGGPGTVHSASAKAGVIALTKTLAVEWACHRIQVNALCPGFVDTEQSREVLWPTIEGRKRLLARIPAGRFGTIDEIVEAGLYLCSPMADYITGEVLTIDGGEWLNKGAFVLADP